jgi:hypothetical protein
MITSINNDHDILSKGLAFAEKIQLIYDDPNTNGVIFTRVLDDRCSVTVQPDGSLLVAFAGTRNVPQWVNNAKHLAMPNRLSSGALVHPGAQESFYPYMFDLLHVLRQFDALEDETGPFIDVTGHSRGGFHAPEFCRLFGETVKIRDVMTFGAPRTGDNDYNSQVGNQIYGRWIRLNNNNDPVVWVPGTLKGYRHIGEQYHFTSSGKMLKNGLGAVSGTFDGAKSRFKEAWANRAKKGRLKEFFLDGIDDHRLVTGYIPVLRENLQKA